MNYELLSRLAMQDSERLKSENLILVKKIVLLEQENKNLKDFNNTTLDQLGELILIHHEKHEGLTLTTTKVRKVIKTPLKQSNSPLKLGESTRHNMCVEKKTAKKASRTMTRKWFDASIGGLL